METPLEGQKTPPCSYLLTPPSTGRMAKRVRFSNVEDIDDSFNNKAGRAINANEGESPEAFFVEFEESLDTEIRENSDDGESTPSPNNTVPPSPASAGSLTTKPTALEKHNPFASLALAIDTPATTEPFRFMDLPIFVRNNVYAYLLVVPGLICVRQKHTTFHDEKKAFLYAERREFLPGIAYALVHSHVDGHKTRFSLVGGANINILRVNKEIFTEAKAVLYSKNAFEIVRPTNELSPPPDFSVRLFPTGCQRLVTNLNIKIRSFYDLHWLLSGGYNVMKNYYRGLVSLTLVLEMDSTSKGFGKTWARTGVAEKWENYVQRLQGEIAKELSKKMKVKDTKVVPTWMNLRVLFSGDGYDENVRAVINVGDVQRAKQDETRQGLVEAWESFKKRGK